MNILPRTELINLKKEYWARMKEISIMLQGISLKNKQTFLNPDDVRERKSLELEMSTIKRWMKEVDKKLKSRMGEGGIKK